MKCRCQGGVRISGARKVLETHCGLDCGPSISGWCGAHQKHSEHTCKCFQTFRETIWWVEAEEEGLSGAKTNSQGTQTNKNNSSEGPETFSRDGRAGDANQFQIQRLLNLLVPRFLWFMSTGIRFIKRSSFPPIQLVPWSLTKSLTKEIQVIVRYSLFSTKTHSRVPCQLFHASLKNIFQSCTTIMKQLYFFWLPVFFFSAFSLSPASSLTLTKIPHCQALRLSLSAAYSVTTQFQSSPSFSYYLGRRLFQQHMDVFNIHPQSFFNLSMSLNISRRRLHRRRLLVCCCALLILGPPECFPFFYCCCFIRLSGRETENIWR